MLHHGKERVGGGGGGGGGEGEERERDSERKKEIERESWVKERGNVHVCVGKKDRKLG